MKSIGLSLLWALLPLLAQAETRQFQLTPSFKGATQVQFERLASDTGRGWQGQLQGAEGFTEALPDKCLPEQGNPEVVDAYTVDSTKPYLVVLCRWPVDHSGFDTYAIKGWEYRAFVYTWIADALVKDEAASQVLSGYEGNMAIYWINYHWYISRPLATQKLKERVQGRERDSLKLAHRIVLERLKAKDTEAVSSYLSLRVAQLLRDEPLTVSNAPLYNDLGYALQEASWQASAYELFSKVERVVPERVVLKLNIADALWGLYKPSQAAGYYTAYIAAMQAAGKERLIPARALERSRGNTR
ncbi:hypothetical protein CYD26_12375 [Pseudomonas sp. FFUP_PS_473]|uniref:hypothetical protein n=1 Tax=Pseudomonas sp. FFUP_PS_473 TaxID=2060418 RepID=UPI000C7B71DF|nr:hypothetical protein [Pseudomonas sp. FFUP_PS_473]PLP91588.1 hypothetical protein CYD26_12375 [Pseudomonas sp. FFUP_PS_473]